MNSIKPVVDQKAILSLLPATFAAPVENLTLLEGGQVAQTLSFTAGGQAYILRFNPASKVGWLGDLSYAISHKMAGRRLLALARAEYEQTLPSLMCTLHAIHQVDVSAWPGCGWIGDDGTGLFPSWQSFIANIIEEERPDGFFGAWHALFEATFLEREFFETVSRRMLELLPFCPEDRRLVQGRYGFNNVLAEDVVVTAVLDWADAMYGDVVYDVAWLAFWDPGHDYAAPLRTDYAGRGVSIPNFEQRLLCYQSFIVLDGLRFNAKRDHAAAYTWVKDRISSLLSLT